MIYTRRGDEGLTHLIGPGRVSKADLRVVAYGEVDELNAWLGYILSMNPTATWVSRLQTIQTDLFTIGAYLALDPTLKEPPPNYPPLPHARIAQMEKWIDEALEECPPMRAFILPGGTPAAAALHIARTVCRRAERAVVHLHQNQSVPSTILVYLNRLSDYLFALARLANHRAGVNEIEWHPSKSTGDPPANG